MSNKYAELVKKHFSNDAGVPANNFFAAGENDVDFVSAAVDMSDVLGYSKDEVIAHVELNVSNDRQKEVFIDSVNKLISYVFQTVASRRQREKEGREYGQIGWSITVRCTCCDKTVLSCMSGNSTVEAERSLQKPGWLDVRGAGWTCPDCTDLDNVDMLLKKGQN